MKLPISARHCVFGALITSISKAQNKHREWRKWQNISIYKSTEIH